MGLIPPDKFIPIAEQSGLILPISDWVLRTACRQSRNWRDSGITQRPIAVNVSAWQYRSAAFVGNVAAILDQCGTLASSLELELTESMIIDQPEDVIKKLKTLKSNGGASRA